MTLETDIRTIAAWLQDRVGMPIRVPDDEIVRLAVSRFATDIRDGKVGAAAPPVTREVAVERAVALPAIEAPPAEPAPPEPRLTGKERREAVFQFIAAGHARGKGTFGIATALGLASSAVAYDVDSLIIEGRVERFDGELSVHARHMPRSVRPPAVDLPPPVVAPRMARKLGDGTPERDRVLAEAKTRRESVLDAFRTTSHATVKDVADRLGLTPSRVYSDTLDLRREKRMEYADGRWTVLDPPSTSEPGLQPIPGVRHEDCNNINSCLDDFLQKHGASEPHGSCPPGCTALTRSE